jgi:hypothetical protein
MRWEEAIYVVHKSSNKRYAMLCCHTWDLARYIVGPATSRTASPLTKEHKEKKQAH